MLKIFYNDNELRNTYKHMPKAHKLIIVSGAILLMILSISMLIIGQEQQSHESAQELIETAEHFQSSLIYKIPTTK